MTAAIITFLVIAGVTAVGFIAYVVADIIIEKKTKPVEQVVEEMKDTQG